MIASGMIGFLVHLSLEDDRAVIEDSLKGSEFELLQVDGEPVQRSEKSLTNTRIPHALVEPGRRTLTISKRDGGDTTTLETEIYKNFRYRLGKNQEGQPILIITKF